MEVTDYSGDQVLVVICRDVLGAEHLAQEEEELRHHLPVHEPLGGRARSWVVTMSIMSLSWASPEMALTSSTISFLFQFAL